MAVAGIQGPGKHFMALLPVKLMLDGFFSRAGVVYLRNFSELIFMFWVFLRIVKV